MNKMKMPGGGTFKSLTCQTSPLYLRYLSLIFNTAAEHENANSCTDNMHSRQRMRNNVNQALVENAN